MAKKRWADLSRAKRTFFGVSTAVQLSLTVAALVDIRRRPADQIKGSKRLWTWLAFVNFVGPIAYFSYGRRRPR